jgi:superfamily II DNA/RNA helicase
MFVTPEAAVGEPFGHYINRQRAMGRLDRIVVDECHVVLDSVGGFRSRMLGLSRLLRAETQMVYLTATMPPKDEQRFMDVMGLPAKQEMVWLRGQTTRKNIGYRVVEYDMEEEEEAVVELVEVLKRRYPLPGQIVVYCGTVARTMQLGEALGAVCYHRAAGSAEQKKEMVRQLTSGERQVFTATNALGLGIDAPRIRAVVHVGTVRKTRQWAQESGRAGRDGQRSEAIVMRGYREVRGKRVFVKFRDEVEEEMQEVVAGEGCMRVVIDRAMDGRVDRESCEEDEAVCQRCESRRRREGEDEGEEEEEEEREEGEAERGEFAEQRKSREWLGTQEAVRQGEEAQEVEGLRVLMERWSVGCQWCRAEGLDGLDHEVEECVEEGGGHARDGVQAFEESWRVVPFSCCYECRLPQALCQSFEYDVVDGGYRKQAGRRCQYLGVLEKVFVVATMRGGVRVIEEMEKAMEEDGVGVEGEDEEVGGFFRRVVRWGAEKKRWGGIEGNQLSRVIRRIVEVSQGSEGVKE